MPAGVMAAGESKTELERFKKGYRYEQTVHWKYDANGNRDRSFCPNCIDDGEERRQAAIGDEVAVVGVVGATCPGTDCRYTMDLLHHLDANAQRRDS